MSISNSINVPILTAQMINEYLSNKPEFNRAEFRFEKLLRSGRDGYTKQAIGKLKISRQNEVCTVQMDVAPEHKMHEKNYPQKILIDERNQNILETGCAGCVSRLGGCKHIVAALFWLLKENEDPSPTSVANYWRPPPLNDVRTKGITLEVSEMKSGGQKLVRNNSANPAIFQKWKERAIRENLNCQIMPYLIPACKTDEANIDLLVVRFKEATGRRTFLNFTRFCKQSLTSEICEEVEKLTRDQGSSKIWHLLRFARVTASIFYEFSRCKTPDGSLVQKLFGGKQFNATKAMKRGSELEIQVIELLKSKFPTIRRSGLYLSPDYPLYGASPDAETSDFIIEIKCPVSNETKRSYVNNGVVQDKVIAQIQLQMLLTQKQKGFLVVVDPQFEKNKEFELIEVKFERSLCNELISMCNLFYKDYVFSKLMERE